MGADIGHSRAAGDRVGKRRSTERWWNDRPGFAFLAATDSDFGVSRVRRPSISAPASTWKLGLPVAVGLLHHSEAAQSY